jgi:hypothetical protein
MMSYSLFAAKIGTNSIGFGIGMLEYGLEGTENGVKTDYDLDGFAFGLGGNLSIISLENSNYGLDASFSLVQGLELGPIGGTEADLTSLTLGLRPHTKLGNTIIFADLGFNYSEIEAYNSTESLSVDDTAFAAGFGAEVSIGKLYLQPNLRWIFVGSDTYSSDFDLGEQIQFSIPISYPISDKIDITFVYSHTFVDDYTYVDGADAYTIDPYVQFFAIGLDYKY